jgi:predicted transcriptional regulator
MMARQRHGLPKTVVRAILTLLDRGTTQQDIADLYGISREAVSAIATGRAHKTVDRAEGARQTSSQAVNEINQPTEEQT